jgi:glycerophosphoryl diester phosphodiesterase
MGHAPENTLASFRKGIELGAALLELDVQVSRDDQLVVMHDATIDRTTNGHGFVKDLTAEEIRRFDAGSWYGGEFAGQRAPLFGEVVELAKGRVGLAVEVKNGPVFYPRIAELLVEELRRRDFVDEVLIISFDHPALKRLHELEPRLKIGLLYSCRLLDAVAAARAVGAEVVRPRNDFVTPEDVAALHAAGIAVSPWTVNDEALMRRMIELGADSMGTNYPDRLVRLARSG